MYINGILAPDMTLQRGKEYTFVVETGLGSDPDQTFHPLYITSDPIGKYLKLMKVKVGILLRVDLLGMLLGYIIQEIVHKKIKE